VALLVDGEPVRDAVLRSDAEGEPSRVQLGRFSFWLIDRSGMLGIRVRDPQNSVLAAFDGVDHHAADADWRVPARFLPYATPHEVAMPNVLGSTYQSESPGRLEFEWQGETHTLEPTGSDPAGLFLVFGDATNGKTTYGGGRFLRVPEPDADGRLLLDFNRSYNPPCAFSPFTTCPLPTESNRLPFEVTAGERTPAGH
jgi:uncharacterized protein (DUF1684 family)